MPFDMIKFDASLRVEDVTAPAAATIKLALGLLGLGLLLSSP